MSSEKKIIPIIIGLGIVLFQVVMTQVVTFIFSFPIPNMGNFPQDLPVLFIFILGVTYSIGIFLTGWLAIRWHWLKVEPLVTVRLAATLIGAYLPLLTALVFYHPLEPGNPFFFIAILTGILGFYLPGWLMKKKEPNF